MEKGVKKSEVGRGGGGRCGWGDKKCLKDPARITFYQVFERRKGKREEERKNENEKRRKENIMEGGKKVES